MTWQFLLGALAPRLAISLKLRTISIEGFDFSPVMPVVSRTIALNSSTSVRCSIVMVRQASNSVPNSAARASSSASPDGAAKAVARRLAAVPAARAA
jgi:hypothetical protein